MGYYNCSFTHLAMWSSSGDIFPKNRSVSEICTAHESEVLQFVNTAMYGSSDHFNNLLLELPTALNLGLTVCSVVVLVL